MTLQLESWSQAVIIDREGIRVKMDAFRLFQTRQFVLSAQSLDVVGDCLLEVSVLAD